MGRGGVAAAPKASYTPAPAASSPAWTPAAKTGSIKLKAGADRLSVDDLDIFKIDDLMQLCRLKGVAPGRSPTRKSLSEGLVKAGLALTDLSKGQLIDVCLKMGQPISGDIDALRQRVRNAGKVAALR